MIASDIITYLTAEAVGGTLYDSFEDLAGGFSGVRTIVTSYGGSEPMEVQESADSRIDVARFQTMTQGLDPAATELEAYRVQNVLARVRNQSINGRWYLKITPLQPPFFMKWSTPQSGLRQISYGANYEAMKQAYAT